MSLEQCPDLRHGTKPAASTPCRAADLTKVISRAGPPEDATRAYASLAGVLALSAAEMPPDHGPRPARPFVSGARLCGAGRSAIRPTRAGRYGVGGGCSLRERGGGRSGRWCTPCRRWPGTPGSAPPLPVRPGAGAAVRDGPGRAVPSVYPEADWATLRDPARKGQRSVLVGRSPDEVARMNSPTAPVTPSSRQAAFPALRHNPPLQVATSLTVRL